jgi:hypothetical protein
MSAMKAPATSQPSAADRSKIDPHRTRIGDGTGEAYVRHFKSVKMPGVASSPILPEWLRKRFRERFGRKHTAAKR